MKVKTDEHLKSIRGANGVEIFDSMDEKARTGKWIAAGRLKFGLEPENSKYMHGTDIQTIISDMTA